MGDRASDVKDPPASAEVGRVAGEVDVLRGDLSALVGELGRRRREVLDLRLQLRRHPVAAVAVAAGAALLAGVLVARAVRARRGPARREVPRALARLLEGERRRGGAPGIVRDLAAAAGAALVRGLVARIGGRSTPREPSARGDGRGAAGPVQP